MAMTAEEKKEFKELINEGFKAQKELLEAILTPIHKDIESHANLVSKIPIIEQKLDNHIDTHKTKSDNKKFNFEMWVIIAIFIIDKLAGYITF